MRCGIAERLRHLDVGAYALDYADDEDLAAFARLRAERLGMPCFISNRIPSLI